MHTPHPIPRPLAAPAPAPAYVPRPTLETRLDWFESETAREHPSASAACLLASSLQPLLEVADDAEVSLPAQELRGMLEDLYSTIYDQRTTIRSLLAIARGHIPVDLLREPAFNGMEVQL